MKTQWTKSIGHSKSSSKRKVYWQYKPIQETKKISNEQTNLVPEETRKRTNKTRS